MMALILLLVCNGSLQAGPPLFGGSAVNKLRAANAVVVARVTGLKKAPPSIRGLKPILMPEGAQMHMHPCQMDITIQGAIKGSTPRSLSIYWFIWKECTASNWQEIGVRTGDSFIFYLTKQSQQWRPIADGPATAVVRVLDKGEDIARLVQNETDPAMSLALALVYADANVLRVNFSPVWSHGGSSTGQIWDLVGSDRMTEVWDKVYRSSDEDGRQSICFLASDFGMCTGCVARYLYNNMDRDLWEPAVRHREELIVEELRPSTIIGLQKSMRRKVNDVQQFLRFYSCHSNSKIRSRARYLLQMLFQHHQAPRCLPCDGG
jgi:hypothetical protein